MQHFSENYYWKKRLAKTVFPGEKGKWPENGRNGEKGKRNRMPGKGKRQSSGSEIGAQVSSLAGATLEVEGAGMVLPAGLEGGGTVVVVRLSLIHISEPTRPY